MVSKKSIYYGIFDGFQSPVVPKAPRSLRLTSHWKSSEGSKLCAFELLAAVADKLLQESESSTSSIGQEQKEQIIVPIVKREELEVKVKVKRLKESPESDNDSGLENVSDVKTSDFLKKVTSNVKLEQSDGKNAPSQTNVVEKQSGELTFRDSRVNTRMLNKSYNSVDLPFYKDPVPHFTKYRGNVKTGIKDDDENSFRCDHLGAKMRAFRSKSLFGYRRIRKMLTSRYRKITRMKDYELTKPTSGGVRPLFQNRKNEYKRERCQIEDASKRRKVFHRHSVDRRASSDFCNTALNKVKFSINSFEVPEFYVEISETATIGSLKKTVMEAVRSILGGELHLGILLEGKKVKDNNRTLQQTGISHNCDLKNLGFTLEPRFPEASKKEPPLLLPHDTNQKPSSFTCSPITDVDKNQEIIPLQTEVLTEENHKLTKKADVSQRRIRRPFSVSEVEALVEAVETVGTGRWREVKLRAFDDANHRTYVDLKDKWKTLVHTASITPQQRRGEPVPQDLLDRVLAAHEYWSTHPLKLRRTHQIEPLQILDGSIVKFVGI